jgi:hypothetical protein
LEIGDLSLDHLGVAPLLTFQRYDVELETSYLRSKEIDIDVPDRRVRGLRNMSSTSELFLMRELGTRAAKSQVQDGHFDHVFDPV